MKAAWLRTITGALLVASLLPCAGAAGGDSPGRLRADSPEALLERGMPLPASREFLVLPPPSRAKSPLLPELMRRLSRAGYDNVALSLFEETGPHLAEPVRSEACLEAGRILWQLKEYGKASDAFRKVSRKSGAAPLAAFYQARLLAAAGKAPAALQALSAAPQGGKRSLLEGEIEMARQNPGAALAAWAGAPSGTDAGFLARLLSLSRVESGEGIRELKAIADNASTGSFPRQAAARKALASALLGRKDYDGMLSTALKALETAGRWKTAAGKPLQWDGTREGAARSWRYLASLFPYDEDAQKFLAVGHRFFAATALYEGLQATEADSRDFTRRLAAAIERVSLEEKAVAVKRSRAEEIRKEMLARRRKAVEMRDRLRNAAGSLGVEAWGSRTDPRRAALIGETGRKLAAFRDRLARVRGAAAAATARARAESLPPEDLRMLFYSQEQVAKLGDRLDALEGKTAFLRVIIWNRWKSEYVTRLSVLLGKAEETARALGEAADRAGKAVPPLHAEQDNLLAWKKSLDLFRKKIVSGDAILERGKAAAKARALGSLAESGRELLYGISREERGIRYFAARASTEWRIEDSERQPGAKALPPPRRAELGKEAIRHWEAILPPPGDRDDPADEILYALAELRFEQEEARFLQKEEAGSQPPDYSAPRALFRRVIEEFPGSPYTEHALYGLALSWQEEGAVDNATAAMKGLLARFPGTRYADEIHLRLGEYAFDEYEFGRAEEFYRKVSREAPPEIRVTALFKLGWSLFLQGRPGEAVDPFLAGLLLSPAARKTGGVPREALAMLARSLVEAGMEKETETLLARRDASGHGPAVLIEIQRILDGQNRYDEATAFADRLGSAYPYAAERLDAELVAAEALRKTGKDDESHARRGNFHKVFGPRSAWQKSSARSPVESARANTVSEEGLRSSAFYFHARSRQSPPGDRGTILGLYDAHLSLFPSSPMTGEIAYQRAWLLFEDGKKGEAKTAFEAVALLPGGTRGEASWYMAVQCAKDVSSITDAASQGEVVRLSREYERFFPGGERLYSSLMDRARAHMNLRRFDEAARASERSATLAKSPPELRAALRLAGDARFEREEYGESEKAFRALLAADPPPEEAKEAEKWVGFSMFRRAEKMPAEKAGDAAALFARVDEEFPSLEIAPTARFRAGTSYASAGRPAEAIAAFLSLESPRDDSPLSLDSTRWLARIYEKSGDNVASAVRYERLAAVERNPEERIKILLKTADLFSMGKDEPRARKNLLAVASMPGAPPDLRVRTLFRAGESALMEGKPEEAERHYRETVAAHRAAPETSPEVAGKALFRMAESRFASYQALKIAPPLEKTFVAKQNSLEECAKLYLEAISLGDAVTVSSSLHRLGEAFEDFRSAILASPPPKRMSDREREEYVFLLEEKAAPLEEKAVEAYQRNLRQAVAADTRSDWVEKSLRRLKTLRPARFGKKGEYSFPVVTVPDFRGMIERSTR
ncbi:MAG: tetratricopeptide repeat protein [Deltaproteobacteria bacterium]|nr:tetratricopeptide repeat protein [Deltaproteobacteria bacterium]